MLIFIYLCKVYSYATVKPYWDRKIDVSNSTFVSSNYVFSYFHYFTFRMFFTFCVFFLFSLREIQPGFYGASVGRCKCEWRPGFIYKSLVLMSVTRGLSSGL